MWGCRVRHNWVTELNWRFPNKNLQLVCCIFFLQSTHTCIHEYVCLWPHTCVSCLALMIVNITSLSVKCELPDVQGRFRKGRGTRDQIANIRWITEKARKFQKTSTSALLTTPKPLPVGITNKLWKVLQEMGIPDYLTSSWEICMQVKEQQLEPEWYNRLVSNREYLKAVYCHPPYLTYMQGTAWEMLDWMKHKLESRLPGEISITSDMQMTPPLW